MSGTGNTTRSFGLTDNLLLDGLLRGIAWADSTLYYSFPTSSDEYGYSDQPETFSSISSAQIALIHYVLNADIGSAASAGFSVEGFTNLNIELSTDASTNAHLRFGESDSPGTAEAYYPGTFAQAGDVWFGRAYDFRTADIGVYAGATIIHEIGHALGLKHPHEARFGFPELPEAFDAMEMSIMSYRSFFGREPGNGYTNSYGSYAQSFMMLDIAALQEMYGANYTVNSDDTIYSWLPDNGDTLVNGEIGIDQVDTVNKIFATIWDGGGIDTYDLSAYEIDLTINLAPGESSVFSATQIASLGLGNSAAGNIYNAMLHEGDTRSLIENAIGGSGNDTLIGNQGINMLDGRDGFDTADYSALDYHALVQQEDGSFLGDFGSLGDTLLNIERIVGAFGTDLITIASASNDVIDNSDMRLELQSGNDTLTVLGGDVLASLGSGADSLSISNAAARIEIVDATSEDFGTFFDPDTGEQFSIGYDLSAVPPSSTGFSIGGNPFVSWVTEDDLLYSFDAIASKMVVVFESASLVLNNFVNGALGIVLGDEYVSTPNQIFATEDRDILTGTDDEDTFIFAEGTSVTGAIDTVRDWAPGDTIDLSALNLTADDLELRTISGGSTLKLIEGFSAGQFQLKVDLNSFTVEQVLASIVFENGPTEPTNTAPVANDDLAETDANQAIEISVLGNDTDFEGDALTIDAFTQGQNGSVTDLGNGVLEYTPDTDFFGSDSFTYTISDEDGLESTGTVTVDVAEPQTFNVITGTDDNDSLSGTLEDDEIFGLDGDDFLYGYEGNDILRGGDGVDVLRGGEGDDTLIGGGNSQGAYGDYLHLDAGDDTLIGSADVLDSIVAEAPGELSDTSTQFHIDLSQNLIINDGFGGTDRVENVEDVFLNNAGDDIVIGDDTNNFIISYYGGADTYFGRGGNDNFDLEYAVQLIDGGEGTDGIIFANMVFDLETGVEIDRASGVHVDLSIGLIVDDGYGDQTALQSIERIQGTIFNDRLIGDENDNVIVSVGGDDFIDAAGGDDDIVLNDGNSEAFGGAGNDVFFIDAAVGDIVIAGGEGSDTYFLGESPTTLLFRPGDGDDTLLLSDVSVLTMDIADFAITTTEALSLAQQVGAHTLIDFGNGDSIRIASFDASLLTEANFIGAEPEPPEDFNIVAASVDRETLRGTDEADAFTFAEGTSVNGAIDTVYDWAPGDIIDLSGLGLSAEDFEVRTISSGTVIKLIEGFGAGEFHVKINLNGFSQEEVLASVIYDAAPPPDLPSEAVDDNYEFSSSATFTFDVLENDIDPDGGVFELISFTQPSSGQLTLLEGGVFEFVPDQGSPQSTQFTYTAGDPNGVSSTATVSLEYVGQTIILGTDEDDILYGTPGPDSLVGFNGNDQLFGLEGDDYLVVDDGDAYLDGGPGNDALRGEFGNFTFLGGTGEDRLFLARDTPNQDELVNTIILRPGDGTDTIVGPKTTNEDGEIVIQSTLFLAENDKIDISAFNLTAAQALSLARQEGQSTFIDLGDGDGLVIEGLDVSTLLEATFIGVQPPGDYNIVNASVGQENINGTDAADAFTFAAGTSVNGAIDTIVDWAPGDVIDLSALGLTADNFEVRLAGGGSILKLIEGFGEDEFHLKVNLNGNSQEDVLDSIIYAEPLPPGTFNIIDGTDEWDRLTGTNQADQISGYAGRDYLRGEAGNDLLIGGEGHDSLYGDEGDDRLEGGFGDDYFRTGTGNDFVDGGEGVDTIWYYVGDSVNPAITADLSLGIATYTLDGVAYTDTFVSIENISGGIADDTLRGDANANEIMGQNGHDIIYGGLGNDRLIGMVGDDIVYGGEGDDTIFGGEGRDTLIGGPGNDTLRPGDSVDTLVFETGDGFDTVGDINSRNSRVEFDALSDKIDVTGLGLTRTQALETAVQDGENTFLDFGNGDGILILYFDASSLRVSNFIGVDTEAPASTAPIASEAASNQAFEAVKNWESLEVDGAKSNTSTIFEPVKDFENLSENVSELISEMFEPAQSNVAMVYDWGMDHNQSGAFAGDLLPASIQPLEAVLYGFGFVEAPIDQIPWDIA